MICLEDVNQVQEKLIKTEKRVRSKVRGKPLDATREHYLRRSISCQSPLCLDDCEKCGLKGTRINSLSAGASHYVVPCFDVLQKYLEVLEISEICGIIFLQSLVTKVNRDISKKHYDRILKKIRNTQNGCIIFLNELHKDTYISRQYGQSHEEWLKKITCKAAEWYSSHLNKEISIVLLSEDPEFALKYDVTNFNIEVLPVEKYLKKYWPNVTFALELYDSITSSSEASQEQDTSKSFEPYLSIDVLRAGIKAGIFFRGNLRVNKHHAQDEAFVTCSIEPGKELVDVLIAGQKYRNRAVHLDEVVIKVLPKNEWQNKIDAHNKKDKENDVSSTEMPTGKVVGILCRKWRDCVATLPDDEDYMSSSRNSRDKILVIPYNYCIPKIRICTKQAEKLKNQRIIVRIDNWEVDSQYPNGHFVKILGELGQLKTEVSTILVEYNISTEPFSKNLLSELSALSEEKWKVEEKELIKRKDLRDSHLIFSIDPEGCEDVDDALSVRELSDGFTELGVHIADVSYFVRPLSLIDQEAQIRSTSVYLPDKRFDMLPHFLSGNICSLLGGVDRYAVSVIWQLDNDCSVKDVWFGRTIIRSAFKLTYDAAQSILDKKSDDYLKELIPELNCIKSEIFQEKITSLKDAVVHLNSIAHTLKRKRFEVGALELDTADPQFHFDNSSEANYIKDVKPKQEVQMCKVVAECMIFANNWVAKKIVDTFPSQAVVRGHPAPREADLKQLKSLAKVKDIDISVQSNKELAYSLEQAQDQKHPCISQVMRMATVRGMSQAVYIVSGSYLPNDYYHYGLGLDRYTHFTSPIRRYADILVHRLLLAAVGEENPEEIMVQKNVNEICEHINDKHRASQDCAKNVRELYQSFYFLNSENDVVMDAIIYAIYSNGVLVFAPQYALNGSLCLCNKEQQVLVNSEGDFKWLAGSLEVADTEVIVKALNYSQKYKLLEHISVKVKVQQSRTHGLHLVFDLVDQKPQETCSAIFTSTPVESVTAQSSAEENSNESCKKENHQIEKISKNLANKSRKSSQTKNLYELIRHLKKLSVSVPVNCKIV